MIFDLIQWCCWCTDEARDHKTCAFCGLCKKRCLLDFFFFSFSWSVFVPGTKGKKISRGKRMRKTNFWRERIGGRGRAGRGRGRGKGRGERMSQTRCVCVFFFLVQKHKLFHFSGLGVEIAHTRTLSKKTAVLHTPFGDRSDEKIITRMCRLCVEKYSVLYQGK